MYDFSGTPRRFLDIGFVTSDAKNPQISYLKEFPPSLDGKFLERRLIGGVWFPRYPQEID